MISFLLNQFLTGLAEASSLFLVASGLTIIFGITRIVNLAHGSLYMLGAYVAYSLTGRMAHDVVGFWASILLAAAAVATVGMMLEILVLRRIYHLPEVLQLLATFGILLIVQDSCRYIWGAGDLIGPRAPRLGGSVNLLGHPFPQYSLLLIVAGPALLALMRLLVHHTRWGILVRAATQDRQMAAALGINESWLFTSVFFAGCFLAGLGGALQVPRQSVNLHMDLNILVEAFIVVIVGGMGSIIGAYLVAVILGVLQAFGTLLFPTIAMILPFLVMAVMLVVRPSGLFGHADYMMRGAVAGPEPPRSRPGASVKIVLLVLAAVLLALPAFFDEYALAVITEMIIFALFAVSLHFMMASGLVSFGHAVYFGFGAYAAAMLVRHLSLGMELSLIAAPIVAGIAALVFGWFCVRLSGVYQGMLSLAFAQISWAIVFQWYDFTGGDNGTLGIWPSDWASSKTAFYYLTLFTCVGGILILFWLLTTPFGLTMRATRDSPQRSEAIGIGVRNHHWAAFSLGGLFAGLAGGIYAFSKGSVFPGTLDLATSLDSLVIILLGGVNTLIGPLVGSVIFKGLEQQLTDLTDYWRLVLGVIVILLIIAFPEGVVGFIKAHHEFRQRARVEQRS